MENSIAYAEIFEILSYMDKQLVMKIPIEILEMIKRERKKDYVSKIDKNDLFNINNVSKQARNIFAYLNFEYWATEEERKILSKIYLNNEKIQEEKKKQEYYEKYNKNIFEPKTQANDIASIETYVPVEPNKELYIKKENIFDKIRKFIKNFLNID